MNDCQPKLGDDTPKNRGNAGKGRPKGSVNKSTGKAREIISMIVEDNAHKIQGWIDEVALEDKKEAFKMLAVLLEYTMPKLARVDATVTGEDGGPINHSISVDFVKPEA